jgi:acetyltransferase-like isoleucine patch superfamily enzyme
MRIPKYLWFHLVTLATAWFPDLTPLMRVRGFFLRPCFKSCGRNLQVARRVTINFSNRMEIGRDVYIATGSWIHAWGGVVLEDEVQLGPYSVLVTGDHSLKDGSYRYGPSSLAPIRICRGSWVAAHAVVTKGVALGRGALIAANSVATRSIPDFAIAAGAPARILNEKSGVNADLTGSPVREISGDRRPPFTRFRERPKSSKAEI